MNSELIKFFSVQRQIFGVCSCCGDIFRLSDAKVYLKEKPHRKVCPLAKLQSELHVVKTHYPLA